MVKVATIVLGALLLVGGIYCMVTPVATYSALGWVIGLCMLVEGIGSVIAWNDLRRVGLSNGWILAGAIVSILLGVFLLGSSVAQYAVDMFIAYLIAIWLVFAGITRVVIAISIRSSEGAVVARGWVLQLVLGVLIAILGVMCIFNPLSIITGVGVLLGISIALTGVALVAGGIRM